MKKILFLILIISTGLFAQTGKSVLTQPQKDSVNALINIFKEDSLLTWAETQALIIEMLNDSAGYVRPETYGATTDGVDCADAINTAIATGKAVYFKSGVTYSIGSTITLASNSRLYSDGATIRLLDGSNTKMFIAPIGAENIELIGLKFNGNFGNQTISWRPDGITFDSCKNITFTLCSFDSIYNHPIRFDDSSGTSSNIRIANCIFRNNGSDNIELKSCHNVVIANNIFDNWGCIAPTVSNSINFQNTGSQVTITGNVFRADTSTVFAIEAYLVGGATISNFNLIGNSFYGYAGVSAFLTNAVLSSNTFTNGHGTWRSGFELIGTGITVTNNTLDNGAIVLEGIADYTNSGRSVISNNNITTYSVGQGAIIIGGTDTVSNVVISGNNINLPGDDSNTGIYIGYYGDTCVVRNVKIINNIITAKKYPPAFHIGIRFYTDSLSKNITIENNDIYNCYLGIRMPADDNLDSIYIKRNNLINCDLPISNLSIAGTFFVSDNEGYRTSNSGDAIITNDTTVTVTHGLSTTPLIKNISVTPQNNMYGQSYYVGNITSTTFNIYLQNVFVYDTSFIKSFSNGSEIPYDTFTSSDSSITSAINTSGTYEGAVSNAFSVGVDSAYYLTFDLTLNSGGLPFLNLTSDQTGWGGGRSNQVQANEGSNTFFLTATHTGTFYLQVQSPINANFSMSNVRLRKILSGAGTKNFSWQIKD